MDGAESHRLSARCDGKPQAKIEPFNSKLEASILFIRATHETKALPHGRATAPEPMLDHLHVISDSARSSADTLRFINGIIGRRVIDHLKQRGYESSLLKLSGKRRKKITVIPYTFCTVNSIHKLATQKLLAAPGEFSSRTRHVELVTLYSKPLKPDPASSRTNETAGLSTIGSKRKRD